MPSLLVFRTISTDFTPPPCVPSAPNTLKSCSFPGIPKVELLVFNQRLTRPATDPLRPINPDNARGFCITAAAGTELAPPYSQGTVTLASSSLGKAVYNPKAFIPHAASLDQAFAHCRIFSTAATRRCWARVSVPTLGNALSRPLPVIALVGRYPTNKLIGRRPFPARPPLRGAFTLQTYVFSGPPLFAHLSMGYGRGGGRYLRVPNSSATTRLNFCLRKNFGGPFDLHALSTPPAFILS